MAWRHALVLCGLLLIACGLPEQPRPPPTEPPPTSTPVPRRAEDAADAFFSAWQQGQFSKMYDLLSSEAQAATPRDVFVRRYTNIHSGIGELQLRVHATGPASDVGEVPFAVTRSLAIFGDVTEANMLPLVKDQAGVWKVVWQPGLIFAGLTATSTVRFKSDVPGRGRILDRNNKPLAENGSMLAVGVVPGEIKDEAELLRALSTALDMSANTVKQRYQGGQPTWFMPIADRPESERDSLEAKIASIPGVALQEKPTRVYPLGPAAAHVVGYIGHPTMDDLRQRASAGYDESDWVGRSGFESWAEERLAGSKGGAIQIIDQAGRTVRTIAQKASVPGENLQLTLDRAIQRAAFEALGDKTGSVVVLDPRENHVLALASTPSFDPSHFVIGLSDAEWQALNGPDRPLVLRATESAYPTGSIFKVITMAAGMEKNLVMAADTFDCGLDWHGLSGVTLHNWQAQGTLNLAEALTQSCNPAFYEIGLRLDRLDPTILPTYARAFGLGSPTGVSGLREVTGTVPDPAWKQHQIGESWASGDSVNLAIGQGYLLATPLQMANAYAALARGGALLPPSLMVDQERQPAYPGFIQVKLNPTTLAAILDGMKRVTSTSRGTAFYAFRDEKLAIAAKTGSAENEGPDAHAWFVGFTPPDTSKARLLVLVMIEGGQHGGTVAAPVARTVIDMAYPLVR